MQDKAYDAAIPQQLTAALDDGRADHHSVYCPNCSRRLLSMRCKLLCDRCGYYLSCADYY